MKKILLICFVAVVFLTNVFMTCSKMEETILKDNKTKVMKHNYIIINSVDNTPVEVEVSYSVYRTGNSENIVKTERKTTPFILGGEEVKIEYDSLELSFKGDIRSNYNKIRREFMPKGADYLYINNLSAVDLEYCVIGNEEVEYYSLKEISNLDISNKNDVNSKKMLKWYPTPIYKGTSILYLLYPEKSPQKQVYIYWKDMEKRDGLKIATASYAKSISLKTPIFGEVRLDSPYSLNKVLELYREEFTNKEQLFDNYEFYNNSCYSFSEESLRYSTKGENIKWYGIISAGDRLENKGQLYFINICGRSKGSDYFGEKGYY